MKRAREGPFFYGILRLLWPLDWVDGAINYRQSSTVLFPFKKLDLNRVIWIGYDTRIKSIKQSCNLITCLTKQYRALIDSLLSQPVLLCL